MAYQIYQFNDVALPLYNPQQEHNVGVGSTLTPAIGGVADYYGSRRRLPQITQFAVRGVYAGDLYYLVDESGNNVDDGADILVIAGDEETDLRAQLDLLRGVIGTRGTLYRKRWDDLAAQWKSARLLQVRRSTATKERTIIAELECTFDAPDARWRHASLTTASASLVDDGTLGLNVNNSGPETVEDATLTITASGTITRITVTCVAQGVSFAWAGSLASGQALIIDCGALTVRKNIVDAYADFTLASDHTARTWLPLAAGLNTLLIASDGPGTAAVTFYAQYL
jgi:hypothetical protein